MVLVDTSIWVRHLSRGDARLAELLHEGEVLSHPFVIGELACGRMRNRGQILGLFGALPQARLSDHAEILHLVEQHRLYGRGLGWIDVHLLGSAILSSCGLWTADKTLQDAARALDIAGSAI